MPQLVHACHVESVNREMFFLAECLIVQLFGWSMGAKSGHGNITPALLSKYGQCFGTEKFKIIGKIQRISVQY